MSARAKISALGTWTPPRLLTNADLERMVDTSDEWITSRVGIQERHIVEPGMATSHMAVEAARRCLAARGVDPTEVEVIIVGTVTPDMLFPATACLVQDRLGAKGAWGFDLSAACSGFVYALQMGRKLVESGAQKKVLVIGADTMSSIIDYTDRATCVLFGDGAGAVLIEPAEDGELGMIDFHHEIDGSGACALYHARRAEACIRRRTRRWTRRCTTSTRMGRRFTNMPCARWSRRRETVAGTQRHHRRRYCGASSRTRPTGASSRPQRTGWGCRAEKVIINIDRFGNTTRGTIPLAMETARQEGKLKKGDTVLIASVGAGFTVGAALLRWEC